MSYTTTETFDRKRAREWLNSMNNCNRKISKAWAEYLAGAMRRGEWVDTNATLGVDKNQRIADGQHRLLAIELSDTVQTFQVVWDVEPFNGLVPGGKARSSVDNFDAMGIPCNKYTASAIKTFAKFIKGTTQRVPDSELVHIFYRLGEEIDTARAVTHSLCARSTVSYGSAFPVVYMILSRYYMEHVVKSLFEQVLGGINNKSGSRELILHNRLAKRGGSQSKLSVHSFFSDMIRLMPNGKKGRKKSYTNEQVEQLIEQVIREYKEILE